MDGDENGLFLVRRGIVGKGSIETGVMELEECLSSIKDRTSHHQSSTFVCRFYDNVPAASETSESRKFG